MVVGAVLWILSFSSASLASTLDMSRPCSPFHPYLWQPKVSPDFSKCLRGREITLFWGPLLRRQSFLLNYSEHGPLLRLFWNRKPSTKSSFFRLYMSCTCRNVQNIVACSGNLNFEHSLGESHLQQNLRTISMKHLYRWPPFYDGSAYNFLTLWWYKSVSHSVEMYFKW